MGILSRAYILASIALLCPILLTAHRTTRRSLNFSPPHPKAKFHIDPLPIRDLDSRDPHQTAHAFLHKHAYPDGGYIIRKDSYTDENTGVSHIYIRQIVNGLEVADGNLNLNIRDGQVLSYGNSFFEGSVKPSLLPSPNWHQGVYCSQPSANIHDPACGAALDRLQAVASLYEFDAAECHRDPRAAAFFFMQVAHPDPASLASTFTALETKHHKCTDPLEEDISCNGWLVTGLADGLEPIHARQVYVQTPGIGGLTYLNLAWRLEVSLPDNHYEAYVSANDPTKIISMADWVVDAPTPDIDGWLSSLERQVFGQLRGTLPSLDPAVFGTDTEVTFGIESRIPATGTYRVWKWGINDPESGKRTLEVAPTDKKASPLGWHSVPAGNDPLEAHPNLEKDVIVNYTTTIGNNIIAQENLSGGKEWKTNSRPHGGSNLIFDFPYGADPSEPGWQHVEPREYINATITHLFYLANMYHDLLYLYGFDEVSGNFQQHNFGKGGAEGDGIILNAQDGSGYNNANFLALPDGRNGLCRMYVWNTAKPFRDGGLDAGILIHELSHGLSSRLTGGPRDSGCLKASEAGGMGEGWGDFIAITIQSTSTYKDFPIGAWASNQKNGIRGFPYSTNKTVNPTLYDRIQYTLANNVHKLGEVWAEILFVVSNKLIEKHGFADSLFPSSDSNFYRFVAREDGGLSKVPKHGNTLMLQLVVDGMKTQPCNPTFIQARDAILAADKALTGGENACTLWKGFASRGLGSNAKNNTFPTKPSINGFDVPDECK